jgi:hypothetical protein
MSYFNELEDDDMRELLMQWMANEKVPYKSVIKLSFYGFVNRDTDPPSITKLGLAFLEGDKSKWL